MRSASANELDQASLVRPFTDACAEAEELIRGASFIKTDQDLTDGLDYLAGSIRASLQMAWAYDLSLIHI